MKKNKNILIHGSIGSGKSYLAQQVACQLMFDQSDYTALSEQEKELYNKHVELVHFNSSCDYKYLIEDLISKDCTNTESNKKLVDGILKHYCKKIIDSKPEYINQSIVTQKQYNPQSSYKNQTFNKYHKIPNQEIDSLKRLRYFDFYSAKTSDEEIELIRQQLNFYIWHGSYCDSGLVIPGINSFDTNTNNRVFGQSESFIKSYVDAFFEEYMNIPIKYKYFGREYEIFTGLNNFGILGYYQSHNQAEVCTKQSVIEFLLHKENYQGKDRNPIHYGAVLGYAIESYARHPKLNDMFRRSDSNYPIIEPSNETVTVQKELPYVLIIDDLDNGSINNSFGEIVKCVDKRGIAHSVKTKYQSYLDKDDIFFNGFYLPENLYIIGTMNDAKCNNINDALTLNQSFASKNINVMDTQNDILETLPNEYKEIALTKLSNLNDCLGNINEFNGLSIIYYKIGAGIFKDFIDSYLENNPNIDAKELFNDLWEYKLKHILSLYLVHNSIPESNLSLLEKAYNKESEA